MAALGVGFPYIASMPADFYQSGLIDFVEIRPKTLRRQPGASLTPGPDPLEQAGTACRNLPTVVHGSGLSIGSADGCNSRSLELLDMFRARWPFAWHGEQLSLQAAAPNDGAPPDVVAALPLPPGSAAVELVARRAAAIGKRYGVPFLLDPRTLDDIGVVSRIMERGSCYQLLDLHNIYCTALNHELDPFDLIDRIALDRVVEIHIAGGSWRDGLWMDTHSGRVPPPVWRLLEYTLLRTPNVSGVVFDIADPFVALLGSAAITAELQRARAIWVRSRMAKLYAAA